MNKQFNVTYHICNPQTGEAYTEKAKVEFCPVGNTYGNKHMMSIKSKDEPFGRGVYDIRYDTEFHNGRELEYIVRFYSNRYLGEDEAWELLGISVYEAEFEEGE